MIMQQRVLTFTKRFTVLDSYSFNLDAVTSQLNADGWVVKQIISTSFTHELAGNQKFPVMAISLLVEKSE